MQLDDRETHRVHLVVLSSCLVAKCYLAGTCMEDSDDIESMSPEQDDLADAIDVQSSSTGAELGQAKQQQLQPKPACAQGETSCEIAELQAWQGMVVLLLDNMDLMAKGKQSKHVLTELFGMTEVPFHILHTLHINVYCSFGSHSAYAAASATSVRWLQLHSCSISHIQYQRWSVSSQLSAPA